MSSADLSPRLHTVAGLLAAGATNQEIADRLTLSPTSVRTYVERVRDAFHVPTTRALVATLAAVGSAAPDPVRAEMDRFLDRAGLHLTLAAEQIERRPVGTTRADLTELAREASALRARIKENG